MNPVAHMLLTMGEHKSDAGGTKAERLLDQLRYIEKDVVHGWPIETLIMGLANAADTLASDARGDDWGYPRIYYLIRAMLRQLKDALPPERFDPALKAMFEASPSLGFLSYLLRDETFGHGFYGDRPSPTDRLTTRDGFDAVRQVMRYAAGGIDTVMAEPRATDMLYAWSQAGAREDVAKRVAAQAGDDAWLLRFVRKLYSANATLSLDGMSTFFNAPAAIVRRIYDLSKAKPDNVEAASIILSLKANVRFDDGDFEEVLLAWEAREAEKADDTGEKGRP